MKTKTLFIILFALILIGVLYVTTKYAEELQSVQSSSNTNTTNVPVLKIKPFVITYKTFNGTYNGSKSFLIKYPSSWVSVNAGETTTSENITFQDTKGDSMLFNVYNSCENISNIQGHNTTLYGFKGVEIENSKSLSFYSPAFSIVLKYNNSQRLNVFDTAIQSLKLYGSFTKCLSS